MELAGAEWKCLIARGRGKQVVKQLQGHCEVTSNPLPKPGAIIRSKSVIACNCTVHIKRLREVQIDLSWMKKIFW